MHFFPLKAERVFPFAVEDKDEKMSRYKKKVCVLK